MVPSCSTRPPSSTSTSRIAWSASNGWWQALDAGLRTADDLLDRVWSDAPSALRPAATATLTAHLDKLDEEGRLPAGVERPQLSLLGEP